MLMDFQTQFDSLLRDNHLNGFIVFVLKNPDGTMSTTTSLNNVSPPDLIGGLEIVKHAMINKMSGDGSINGRN